MPIYPFNGKVPRRGDRVFVAPSADLIGDVEIGDDVSIWFQTMIRGDMNTVRIGSGTNIQDLCMIHVSDEYSCTIGSEVTVGHQANLHGCVIGDNCLIGIGATILDGVEIGDNCLVAAGALVPPGKKYPPGSFIIGSPAVVKRPLTPEEVKVYGEFFHHYLKLKEGYLSGMLGDPIT
ncbi:gamma carbonic anhydrase family protein [Myxococcota bacterium]|nr:gamma carbonic anhydrase family protein [Myxococcota bacterium]